MKKLVYALSIVLLSSVLAIAAGSWNTNHWTYTEQQTTQGSTDYAQYSIEQTQLDVRLGSQRWVGDTNISGYNTLANAIATLNASGETATLHVPKGSYTLSAGLTVNSNICLTMESGAVITLGDYNLTINGPLEAGRYQVFNCSGSGVVSFADGAVDAAFPEWWTTNTTPGTTDMSTAINAAVTAHKKTLLAPTTYKITSVILMPSYHELAGTDRIKSLIYNVPANPNTFYADAIVTATGPLVISDYVYIHDLSIQGDFTTYPYRDEPTTLGNGINCTVGYGLLSIATPSTGTIIRNVGISNIPSVGIWSGTNGIISDVQITNCEREGILCDVSASNTVISNVQISNTGSWGLDINSGGIKITNLDLYNVGNNAAAFGADLGGISILSADDTVGATSISISNFKINTSVGPGIYLACDSTSYLPVNNVTISNGEITATTTGISLSNAVQNTIFSNLSVHDNTTRGFHISHNTSMDALDKIIIKGCQFYDNTGENIYLGGGTDSIFGTIIIDGCQIYKTAAGTGTYGIYAVPGGGSTSHRFYVRNCEITGHSTANLYINGRYLFTEQLVGSNINDTPSTINPDLLLTKLQNSGGTVTVSMGDGVYPGQRKIITAYYFYGASPVTKVTYTSHWYTGVQFTTDRDTVEFVWDGASWLVVSYLGVTFY